MEKDKIVGYVYQGKMGGNPRLVGTIPLLFGVPRVGDTISMHDGWYRVDHVHWIVGTTNGRPTGMIDLHVSPVS